MSQAALFIDFELNQELEKRHMNIQMIENTVKTY